MKTIHNFYFYVQQDGSIKIDCYCDGTEGTTEPSIFLTDPNEVGLCSLLVTELSPNDIPQFGEVIFNQDGTIYMITFNGSTGLMTNFLGEILSANIVQNGATLKTLIESKL